MPDAAVIVAAYRNEVTATRDAAAAVAGAMWDDLDSWRDADAAVFAGRVGPVVEAGQAHIDTVVRAYLAALGSEIVGWVPDGLMTGAAPTYADVRGGVGAAADTYRRPFTEVWSRLADGRTVTDAVDLGRLRAVSNVDTDLMLAHRASLEFALSDVADDWDIVGYRRVPSTFGACRFCIVASTQRYKRISSVELHTSCHCGVTPIWGTADPGHILNRDLLDKMKAMSDRTDYWRGGGRFTPDGDPAGPLPDSTGGGEKGVEFDMDSLP